MIAYEVTAFHTENKNKSLQNGIVNNCSKINSLVLFGSDRCSMLLLWQQWNGRQSKSEKSLSQLQKTQPCRKEVLTKTSLCKFDALHYVIVVRGCLVHVNWNK